MEAYGGVDVQVHSFLTSVLDGRGWFSRFGRFTRGKKSRYPLNMRLGGPKTQSEHFAEKNNLLPLPDRTRDRPSRSPFAILPTLRQVHME